MRFACPVAVRLLGVLGIYLSAWMALHSKSRQTPRLILNRAADAILALKSTRFSVRREGTPAMLDEKNGITFTLAECVYAAPGRVSCDVKVTLKNGTVLQLTRVWVPEGTFQSNPLTRQFGKAPADSSLQRRAAIRQDRHSRHHADRGSRRRKRLARNESRTATRFTSKAK